MTMRDSWAHRYLAVCGISVLALVVTLQGTGCSKGVVEVDERELTHPMMKKAMELEKANDRAGAIRLYGAVVREKPGLARAHLSLAFLLDNPQGDYWQAIYHYQRYLEMRPETEKREMICRRISGAKMALGSGVSSTNTMARLAEQGKEKTDLQTRISNLDAQLRRSQELNERLRAQVTALQAEQSRASASAAIQRLTAPAAAMQPAIRTYRVAQGDTLSKIAVKVYGDQKRWTDIYEANRALLRTPQDMRLAQLLVIPE
jgi:LysM repeat protein